MDNVIKQGVLRKIPVSDRPLSGLLSKLDTRKWCVLALRSGVPYFEFYSREEEMFTGSGGSVLNLTKCKQITYTLSKRTKTFSFCIVLTDDVVQLAAASSRIMLSWVRTIELCLQRLGILEPRDDKHIYSFCPAVVNIRGHAKDEEEVEGAVGGVEEGEDSNPYSLANEDINVQDVEGENIFGTIREVDDQDDSASEDEKNDFFFDWTKEPESKPKIEKTNCTPAPRKVSVEETSGSETFVDSTFWEKNKIPSNRASFVQSKILDSRFKISDNNNNNDAQNTDSDNDDGYCGLSELAQARATKLSNDDNGVTLRQNLTSNVNKDISKTVISNNKASTNKNNLNGAIEALSVNNSTQATSSNTVLGARASPSSNSTQATSRNTVLGATASPSSNSTQATSSNTVLGAMASPSTNSSDKLTVDLSKSGKCGKASPVPTRKDNPFENDYAPFPTHAPVPDLISFDNFGASAPEPETNPRSQAVFTLEPILPVPKPRKMKTNVVQDDIKETSSTGATNHIVDNKLEPKIVNHIQDKRPDTINTNHKVPTAEKSANQNADPQDLINDNLSAEANSLEMLEKEDADSTDEDDHEYTYQGVFDGAVIGAAGLAPPLLPPRIDSLPQNTPKSAFHPAKENSPSFDPKFSPLLVDSKSASFDDHPSPPPLPRRNKVKSEEIPPPLPMRSNSVRSERPQVPPRVLPDGVVDIRAPKRQLSQRMRVDRAKSVHTVISLKQNQIEILKEEMLMSDIKMKIPAKYMGGLALVEACNSVWIAGWNVVEFPRLHGQFHIGDQIISINNVRIISATSVIKQFKHSESTYVDICVKRLPKAKVFVIRRSAEGESLGMKREKGTAEIVYVAPNGLAGQQNLHEKPMNLSETGTCNWFITEINSRPLNLFFKDMEIEHRLGAVGRDISLVVQPLDFIQDLKKHLKKLKNYKSYLIT
ncbi:uncharacterized protein LOC126816153 [Patella vulgata]|uniref:uncharacterized protein LOC126816153 n=1 Tax=Patella vulgata TaxID=6465 RepID=UPI00217F3488|nr:uncharacterized protein LOC126816153 [Patella vulgata]